MVFCMCFRAKNIANKILQSRVSTWSDSTVITIMCFISFFMFHFKRLLKLLRRKLARCIISSRVKNSYYGKNCPNHYLTMRFLWFVLHNKNSCQKSVHRLSLPSLSSSIAQRVLLKARLGLPSFGVTSQPLLWTDTSAAPTVNWLRW